MAKTILDEQEAERVRSQFRDFLGGRATESNVILAAAEAHVDCHNDNHIDHSPLLP